MADHFEKFNEEAQFVLASAQDEAKRLRHWHQGPEHILLALLAQSEGVVAKALDGLGISQADIRASVERTAGIGASPTGREPPLNSAAKAVIRNAIANARRLNSRQVGVQHLLQGLLLTDEGSAMDVLVLPGVTRQQLNVAILTQLYGPPSSHITVHLGTIESRPIDLGWLRRIFRR